MGAKAPAIGVGVENKGAFKDGHDHVAEGMVNHSIAVGRSGNNAGFGFSNLKGFIGTGLIGFSLEFVLNLLEFFFQVVVKCENIAAKAFTFLCVASRQQNILEGDNAGPKISVAFH